MLSELQTSLALNSIDNLEVIIYFRYSDRRKIVVPIHPSNDIRLKTLYGIIKDMGIDPEDFKKLL